MPRIPAADIQRLKETISVARLAEARGVELKRHGAGRHNTDLSYANGMMPSWRERANDRRMKSAAHRKIKN